MSFQKELLQLAIRNLYRVFRRYPLRDEIRGCACCVTEWDQQRLQAKPLAELTSADLGKFAVKAVSSWGSITDFKHFLPRLLELLATDPQWRDGAPEPPVMFAKLRHAQFAQWPEREQRAVQTFLFAWWRTLLESYPSPLSAETALVSIAQIVDNLGDYLDSWQQCRAIAAMRHLAQFVDDVSDDLAQRGTLTGPFWSYPETAAQQVRQWLMSFRTINALENAFFIYSFEQFTGDFNRAAERLIALKDQRPLVQQPQTPTASELLRKFSAEIGYHSSMADSLHSSINDSIH